MAWWKEHDEWIEHSQPTLQASDIMQFYIREEKPIEGYALYHLLEPLAGTSFMQRAINMLRQHKAERQGHTDTRVYPNDLFLVFFGTSFPDQAEICTDSTRQDEATMALHSLSTYAIGLDKILTLPWLEKDEMMLLQSRWDHVYHDREQTQEAFSHNAAQWQFYKAGRYVHTIAEAKLYYLDEAGAFQMHTVLPDGFHDSRFFTDPRQRALVALPHEQQVFDRSYRGLYISPHFSFDAARRK